MDVDVPFSVGDNSAHPSTVFESIYLSLYALIFLQVRFFNN